MASSHDRTPGPSMVGLILFLIIAAAAAFLLARNWISPNRQGQSDASIFPDVKLEAGKGEPIAPDWKVRSLEGKEIWLSDLKGKPVFLNIWATWCGPCLAEMPSIDGLYKSMKGKGVEFLIVSEEKDTKKVAAKVAEQGWSLPVCTSASELPKVFETDGIPATFIVNSQGEVIASHVGAANWDTAGTRDFLLKLLKTP